MKSKKRSYSPVALGAILAGCFMGSLFPTPSYAAKKAKVVASPSPSPTPKPEAADPVLDWIEDRVSSVCIHVVIAYLLYSSYLKSVQKEIEAATQAAEGHSAELKQ